MDDDRWYLANRIFLFCSWRRMLQEARIVDMKLLVVWSTMTSRTFKNRLNGLAGLSFLPVHYFVIYTSVFAYYLLWWHLRPHTAYTYTHIILLLMISWQSDVLFFSFSITIETSDSSGAQNKKDFFIFFYVYSSVQGISVSRLWPTCTKKLLKSSTSIL